MPNVSLLTNGIGDVNQGGQLVPSGTVFSFAGSTAPSGWLLCDGSEYSQTTYASLFSVLGSTYNTQINPTTGSAWASPSGGTFRVPDYRGIFLRSAGQASGLDSVVVGGHQSQGTAKNGLSNASSSVTIDFNPLVPVGASTASTFAATATGSAAYLPNQRHSGTTANGSAVGQVISSTDKDTRPINKGVLYIIKV